MMAVSCVASNAGFVFPWLFAAAAVVGLVVVVVVALDLDLWAWGLGTFCYTQGK